MVTMFIKHKVEDYSNWKGVYDSIASVRKDMGVKGASVHRDAHDANVVTVMHKFNDLNAAKTFAGSDMLKSAMAKAGVAGPPEIWFAEDMEQTSS